MKHIIISFIFIIAWLFGFSQPLTKDEIRTVALNFYKFATKDKQEKRNAKIIKQFTHTFKGIETYAVVVFDNKDWVVLSTDKSLDPILAYSDEGSWSDPINPSAKFWFDIYDYYVYNGKVLKIYDESDEGKDYYMLWEELITNKLAKYETKATVHVAPLLTTKWGQHNSNDDVDPYAYNYYMPPDNGCSHTLAGCPAVAIGQVLRYWKYPFCEIFNWDYMPDSLITSDQNYQIYKKEIANLLRNISDKIEGYQYGCIESGAWTDTIQLSLKNIFKFTHSNLIFRPDYWYYQWKNILCDNLSHKRPVIYAGRNKNGKNHIFVCDGWRKIFLGKEFHFNFGWNGDEDGWYKAKNPNNYNNPLFQQAIVDIYPNYICSDYLTIHQHDRYTFLSHISFFFPKAGTIYSSPESITIENGDIVRYRAYKEIVLENFETEEGADFVAEIVPCPQNINCNNFTNYKNSSKDLSFFHNKTLHLYSPISIYPNPSSGTFTVSYNNNLQNTAIQVYNYLGELILKMYPKTNNFKLDLSSQPDGIYVVKFISNNNVYQQKIVKQ